MKNVLILSLALGVTCLVAGFVLTQAEQLTREAREQARLEARFAAMEAVFPESDFGEGVEPVEIERNGRKFLFYPARQKGELIGFAAFGESREGYGGRIRVLVGIEVDTEKVRKVLVADHEETPGLGTQATDRRKERKLWDLWRSEKEKEKELTSPDKREDKFAELPPNQFLDQFDQVPVFNGEFTVVGSKEEVDDPARDLVAVTGATISSEAVTDAAERTLQVYQKKKLTILERAEQKE